MNIWKILLIIIFLYTPVQAQTDNLVISEIQVGGSVANDEFIELYNPTLEAIDISSWSIQYKGATANTFQRKNFTTGANVSAQGFFLITHSDYDGSVLSDMTQGTISLAASGGNIYLVSNQITLTSSNDPMIIDKVSYGTGDLLEGILAPAPPANQSIERNINTNTFFLQTSPNPQNLASSPSMSEEGEEEIVDDSNPGDVVINEVVPKPESGNEWIELYNNTDRSISINGWKIFDNTGNAIKTLSGSVGVNSFFIIELSSAKLNNSGDIIILRNSYDEIIDQMTYGSWDDGNVLDNAPNAETGKSIARKSNGIDTDNDKEDFAISEELTQRGSNIILNTITVTQGGTNIFAGPVIVPLPKILINEFMPDPEDEDEWIELYNAGEVSMDLDGWWIEEGSEQKTILSGVFIPGQFKVIESIKGNLNNKGDIIRLKTPQGEVADSISYGVWEDGLLSDNAPIPQNALSIARFEDSKNNKHDFKTTGSITKGYENIMTIAEEDDLTEISVSSGENGQDLTIEITTPPAEEQAENHFSERIFINEVLPNPIGSDSEKEWIEIYNEDNKEVDLTGFQIDDIEGGSKSHTLNEIIIKPKEYLVIKRTLTKVAFNNDNDEVRLINPLGVVVDIIEYEEGKEGYAYAKDNNREWKWTSEPTPGNINIIKEDLIKSSVSKDNNNVMKVSIKEVRNLEIGAKVKVQGIVSVEPGVLGSQFFYISGSGIQIYSNKKLFPKISIGDKVSINGTLSQSKGEIRINTKTINDIYVISKGDPPLPHEIKDEIIDEEIEGYLVKINGTIIDKTSVGFLVDTGVDEIAVLIKSGTDIDKHTFIPGMEVSIIGIVGNSASGYRVMPRFQSDIIITGKDELLLVEEEKEEKSPPYAKATAYIFGSATIVALGIRRRRVFTNGFRAALFMVKRREDKKSRLI